LEVHAAALSCHAANLQVAAALAREAANAAAPRQQISTEVSSRRPTFPKANASWKASSVAFQKETARIEETSLSEKTYTTLMCKNVPNDLSRSMFIAMLDSEGLAGLYDLVYVPLDFTKNVGFGYAFVNFQNHEGAVLAMQCLQGFARWRVPSSKTLEVVWSSPHQGLDHNVKIHRNSRIMHDQMPDEYKPILLKDGVRVEFPRPTRRIRAPYSGKAKTPC